MFHALASVFGTLLDNYARPASVRQRVDRLPRRALARRRPPTWWALVLLRVVSAVAIGHAQAPGDANCDGSIDAGDFPALVATMFSAPPNACPGVDVDGDGRVGAADLVALARILAPPPIGPTLTYFGLADAAGGAIGPVGYSLGAPIFSRRVGSGFQIVVEARAGTSGRPPGLVTYDPNPHDPTHRPDLQIEASSTLGDGSREVCLGGVPAINPPDFGLSQSIADALNDFGCNFALSSQGSCTQNEFGQPQFLGTGTQAQFCLLVPRLLLFPLGDTLVSVRLRDNAGNLGPIQQMIVRVGSDGAPTLTPTALARPTATRTASPTRTPTSTRTATGTKPVPSATPTRTVSATPTSRTIRPSASPTHTATITPTHLGPSPTFTFTGTFTRTATLTPVSPLASPTRTATTTPTHVGPTFTFSGTPSRTQTPTLTPVSPLASPTRTATVTPTHVGPTFTFSGTPSRTRTPTPLSPSASPTRSASPTLTQTPTLSPHPPTLTATPTAKATSSRTPSATRTATLTRSPSFTATPTATRTPTPILSATPTRTRSRTPTLSPTPKPTPSGVIGPVITYFGLTRADDTLLDPIGMTPGGLAIYTRAAGAGFSLVVEGRPGISGKTVGASSFDATDTDFPDLQVVVSRALGNGSAAVCDRTPPDAGGVPALDPPSFEATQTNIDTVNDLACRFVDGSDAPMARGKSDACVLFESGDFGFANAASTVQYCGFIDSVLHFPPGDTVVTARLRDTSGNPGEPVQIVVRIGS